MIPRYTRPEMGQIWSEFTKFHSWLQVEIAVATARVEMEGIPYYVPDCLKKYAKIDVSRIEEIDRLIDHDMNAFIRAVSESISEGMADDEFSQVEIDVVLSHLHAGLTSYDVEDTALALRLSTSTSIILEDLDALRVALIVSARRHQNTPQIGRTHLQHAEPITFGLKLLNWYYSVDQHRLHLAANRYLWEVGKISGAVGTHTHLSPEIEEVVGLKLKIPMARASSQIVSREGIAYLMASLANIASSLGKFAADIEHLSSTEVREVFESHASGKTGSSAMPHKSLQQFSNPNKSERIKSLAKLVRANALVGAENIDIRHEQDLTQSASERVIISGSLILVDYMITLFTRIIGEMYVDEERMLENIWSTGGVIFSQHVAKALMDKGMPREDARGLVTKLCQKAASAKKPNFKRVCERDPEMVKWLTPQELELCFDLNHHLRNVDKIFERFANEPN